MFSTPFLDIAPLTGADGCVRLPGSKSISNRVLLLAGLSEGTTTLHDLLDSDDTRVMLDALRALGCTIEHDGERVRVTGLAGRLAVRQARLFLGNAGTAMRPLTAALALLSAAQGGEFELAGVERMHERPIGDLVDALRALGCRIDELGVAGYPPLRVRGGTLDLSRTIRVRGDVSSQFLTALLLALPLVTTDRAVVVEVEGELISRPYVEITIRLLARFGVTIRNDDWQRFTIPARPPAARSARRATFMSKATLRRRPTSSRSARSPRTGGSASASKASAATRSRATSPSPTPPSRWGPTSRAARTGSRCGAGNGRCARSGSTAITCQTPR